jgi:DNA-binding MarR family transcriptional regulator
MALTVGDCTRAAPRERPFKLFDGGGLYLLTQPSGSKYWRFKYRHGGKERLLAFGVFPRVSLEAARERAASARALLQQGRDPGPGAGPDRGPGPDCSLDRERAPDRSRLRMASAGGAAAGTLTSRRRAINIAYDLIAHQRHSARAAPLAEMACLDEHLCFALYTASNHMTRMFAPFLQTLGVTYPQYLVLVALWEKGQRGGSELASFLGMDFGTLSPLLQRLEGKRLVVRRRDAVDQRRIIVTLTRGGQALRRKTQQMLGDFYCFLNVPVDELVDLKNQLHRFVRTTGQSASAATARATAIAAEHSV